MNLFEKRSKPVFRERESGRKRCFLTPYINTVRKKSQELLLLFIQFWFFWLLFIQRDFPDASNNPLQLVFGELIQHIYNIFL